MSNQTPSQTVGPYFAIGLTYSGQNNLVSEETRGNQILIKGRVLDGDGVGISDAMVEIWQADAAGRFNHPADPNQAEADPNFSGFGRAATNDSGEYHFKTIKPGRVPWQGAALQAPHISVSVFARGMLIHAYTRLYFSDEPSNREDPVLNLEGVVERRETLIAKLGDDQGLPAYHFDIHLQGEHETVFFNP
jgi:protocatechuate 3,4-dioxygenase alpha subunit